MKKSLHIAIITIALSFGAYFGAYFLAADYRDIGSNSPAYILRYRIGSLSLKGLAKVFEPARVVDERWFRRRSAIMID
jgi:hypothetical protein